MSIKTAVFIPFISILFYGFINIKVYLILNSLVFIYFFIYLIQLKPGSHFFLPLSYKYFFLSIFVSIISYALSPLKQIISIEYVNFISGFFLFFTILNIDDDLEYKYFYPFLVFIAIFGAYKSFVQQSEFVSTLRNANTLAFLSILIISMLVEQKKYYMALFFGAILISTRSIAAMLSVMFVSFYYGFKNRKNIDFKNNYIVILVMLILFIFLLINIDIKSINDRILWWKACINMFMEKPIFGYGYSSFTHMLSAFINGGLKSSYAHNYFLEMLCENGIIFSILWFYFLFLAIKNTHGFYKYALIASLIHSFFDFGLDTSAGWWFFMFFLALSMKKNKLMFRLGDSYWKYKKYIILFASFLLISWFYYFYKYYIIDRMNSEIINLCYKGEYQKALIKSDEYLGKYPDSIDLSFARVVTLEKIYKNTDDKKYLKEMAKSIEYMLIINPYYRLGYEKLEDIYKMLSDDNALKELKTRKRSYIK